MSDVEKFREQIKSFLQSKTEKTLLVCGVADKEKHYNLLKELNALGQSEGRIYLLHTTRDGMRNFLEGANLYNIKPPKKYGETINLSKLTLSFDTMNTEKLDYKYQSHSYDFVIMWPIQSVVNSDSEIQNLQKVVGNINAIKKIYLTLHEPQYDPSPLKSIVDRVITLDCENDQPDEYKRIMTNYQEEMARRKYQGY